MNLSSRVLPKTLFGRFSLALIALFCTFVAIQALLFFPLYMRSLGLFEQQLGWGIAESYVKRLQPLLRDPGADEQLLETLYDISGENPRIDLFILDAKGSVLYENVADAAKEAANTRRSVPVEMLEGFLAVNVASNREELLPGPHPSNESSEGFFSAARIWIGDRPGYLYAYLTGSRFDFTWRRLGDFFGVTGGFGGFVIFLCALALVSFMTHLFITKRFRLLVRAVQDFGSGKLDTRASVSGEDEIGQLGTSINSMADSIVSSMEQIKYLDLQRREVFAMISHDLKGPVTSMQAYLEQLLRDHEQLASADREQALEVAVRNTKALHSFIEEIFEISRLEAREEEIELLPFSLSELVQEDIFPRLQPKANAKGITLRLNVKSKPTTVFASVEHIDRVLHNLIENAIRYGDPEGNVYVELSARGESVEVSVRDDGKGIPAEDLPHIFEPFYRVVSSASDQVQGSGLGLAIIKKILELHCQEIQVQSVENQGTRFFFKLQSRQQTATQ